MKQITMYFLSTFIILTIIVLIQIISISKRNSYILELEEVIEQKIKLDTKKIEELEKKLNYELVKISNAKKKLKAARRQLKKPKSNIRIIKTKANAKSSRIDIINDFTILDSKITKFEDGLKKLKKGTKNNAK